LLQQLLLPALLLVLLLLALLLGYPPPFAAVQILWNNLVTEGTITVNLAMEPREGDELEGPPRPRGAPLVGRADVARVLLMSSTIVATTLGYFLLCLGRGLPLAEARTGAFTLLAVCEWFNVLSCRHGRRSAFARGLGANPWLVGGLALSVLLQAAVVWIAPLGAFFGTAPLGPRAVLELLALGSVVLWVEEARKAIARRRAAR
jgi:magnesium-transporting ATPase (P-type)